VTACSSGAECVTLPKCLEIRLAASLSVRSCLPDLRVKTRLRSCRSLIEQGEAIDAGDDERVTGGDEVEDRRKLGTPLCARAGDFLFPDHGAACGHQGLALQDQVLIGGRDAGVADAGHVSPQALEVSTMPQH
jgi:hypothetical protein